MSDELLVSVKEAARRLNMSRSVLYEYIARGEIETVRVGRRVSIEPERLPLFLEWLKERSAGRDAA